ncbi:MAG: hypothetical protein ABRQ26_06250 [Syntrophomonadaceae bacterium]
MFQVKEHQLVFEPKDNKLDENVKVILVQEPYPERKVGRRAGQGLYVGRIQPDSDQEELRRHVRSVLARIPENADMGILSEHPGNIVSSDLFQKQADRCRQIIIARLGHYRHEDRSETTNTVAVFSPYNDPVFIEQLSFSEEDHKYYTQGKLHPGKEAHVFHTPIGRMGVISCHDYTNADLIKKMSEYDIEILVVSSFNPATRLFMQYALADIHRFSCFVIISNIANYGGSGVFAPFRYNGPKKRSMTLGGAIAYTQGETSAFLEVDLPLADLRLLRHQERQEGDLLEDRCPWTPIQPSEEFLSTGQPDYKKSLDKPEYLQEIDLAACGYRCARADKLNMGVAQLKCMDEEDYINHYYCISCSPDAPRFVRELQEHLQYLSQKLLLSGQKLDFLVFPEVFLPLTMDEELRDFSRRFNTIIIAGVEYDPQPETLESPELAHGSNRCFIYVPTADGEVKRFQYDKMTRSQYDARLPGSADGEPANFIMDKGSRLLRFSYGEEWAFGVLICYDYSHFDIIHRINRDENHQMPLDMLFIVANNPDSQLYGRCCIADSHRFYQYIVMSNVAQFGGSGVFGPIKTPGLRQTLLDAGVGTEAIAIATVDIKALQEARKAAHIDIKSSFQHKPGIFQMMLEKAQG